MPKTISKLFIFFLLVLAALSNSNAQTDDPTDACIANFPDLKELQILRGKIDLASGPVSLETLSNNKKPNQNEKVAILAFDKTVEKCRNLGKEWRIKNVPSNLNILVDAAFVDLRLALSELYAGRYTYGDFAKKRQELINKLGSQLSAETQRIQRLVSDENERKTKEEQDRNERQTKEEQDRNERKKAIEELERKQRQAQIEEQKQQQCRAEYSVLMNELDQAKTGDNERRQCLLVARNRGDPMAESSCTLRYAFASSYLYSVNQKIQNWATYCR
jgi:hypothetical protein